MIPPHPPTTTTTTTTATIVVHKTAFFAVVAADELFVSSFSLDSESSASVVGVLAPTGVVLELVALELDSHTADANMLAATLLAASPGCDTPLANLGVKPDFHSQHGSPSSSPLVWPSPSESARHNAVVHVVPALEKSRPNVLRRLLSPVPSAWPMAETPATLAPLGTRETNWRRASVS